ncbi:YxeA family protein [Aneurinibacillus uraniidurans]|uniref:YxeA family protein n=1 Tax=Aneurinibacillus uraniidurans TaxID=2966586 RepID=UPI002349E8B3|nr:YxeA family protein [Aneurinibacillus sp. B1]WCN36303.1 YxeA family protein [Aneurinibacillus sp. B1]
MKKWMISLAAIAALIVGSLIFMQNVNVNRFGTDNYYVQITGNGKKIEDKLTSGEKFVTYEYTLPAFDQEGKEKMLIFTSTKPLRKEAYINLFVKEEQKVTSYQEVKKEDIPGKAKEKLK